MDYPTSHRSEVEEVAKYPNHRKHLLCHPNYLIVRYLNHRRPDCLMMNRLMAKSESVDSLLLPVSSLP